MMDKFIKDFLVVIIAEPAGCYLGMLWWNWYATGRGWGARVAYKIKVIEFIGNEEGTPEGLEEFMYSVACNPLEYAWGAVAIAIIVGVIQLVNNSNKGEYN
jgi:hypothetical protein